MFFPVIQDVRNCAGCECCMWQISSIQTVQAAHFGLSAMAIAYKSETENKRKKNASAKKIVRTGSDAEQCVY